MHGTIEDHETSLLDATADFYADRQASQTMFDLTRLRGDVEIGAGAFCRCFDQLSGLINEQPPEKWPSLSGGYFDLLCYARNRPDLCAALGESGSLLNTFDLAARQVISHDKLAICVSIMEMAATEPSRTWRGLLARPEGIPHGFVQAATSLTTYDGRMAGEFFRLAAGNKAWTAALAASGVFKRAIHVCPHQTPLALDILQKAAANPDMRGRMIESGSIREIYDYTKIWKGIVPFQIQCVEPWARAVFPSLPGASYPFDKAANLG